MTEFTIELAGQTGGLLCIASDGAGGRYGFDPTLEKTEMYYYFVQDGAKFPMGLALTDFLQAPRLPATRGEQ